MRRCSLLIALFFLLNSCATLLNGKTTKVKVYAPKGSQVTFNENTYQIDEEHVEIFPKRSKDSLRFTISNDSLSTDFAVHRKTSGMVALNLFVPYSFGVGILVDLTNPRRFTYKRHLKFDVDPVQNEFISTNNAPIAFKRHDVFVYTSPLKAMDVFSQPMLTLGAEYFVTNNLSFSAEYGTVFTERLGNKPDIEVLDNKGRMFRYELKLYNLLSKSKNPRFNKYISFETRFIRYQFNDDITYNVTNDNISYFVNETFGVRKSVNVYNLKYGINYPIGKKFYIDLYTGVGLRVRTIENINRSFNPETDTIFDEDDCLFCFRRNDESDSGTFFNFALGFKFGYKF